MVRSVRAHCFPYRDIMVPVPFILNALSFLHWAAWLSLFKANYMSMYTCMYICLIFILPNSVILNYNSVILISMTIVMLVPHFLTYCSCILVRVVVETDSMCGFFHCCFGYRRYFVCSFQFFNHLISFYKKLLALFGITLNLQLALSCMLASIHM